MLTSKHCAFLILSVNLEKHKMHVWFNIYSSKCQRQLCLSKRNTFQQLKETVSNKLVGWMDKLLSKAGKKTLIKPVA